MEGQLILAKVEDYLQRANQGAPGMSEDIINEAAERVKEILRKTFNESRSGQFRLYASNVGKPACQLVMERNGAAKEPQTAAFRMKMLVGDLTEIVLRAVIKASGTTIDSSNVKVQHEVLPGISIRGEYDFKIRGYIWDAKSASRYAFDNKWSSGFAHIEQYDDFGYCSQLYNYGEADKAKVGGFIVVCKETGKLLAVDAIDTQAHRAKHIAKIRENIVKVLDTNRPFQREFQDQPETFYGKPTGNRVLGITCGFCEFKYACWPGLQRRANELSKAANKPMVYYTHYDPENISKFNEAKISKEQGKAAAKPRARRSTKKVPTANQ